MNRCRFCLSLVCVLSLQPAFVFGQTKAGSSIPTKTEDGQFKGKIVVVSTQEANQTTSITPLEQAHPRKIGERYFITGMTIANFNPISPQPARIVWIPVDRILTLAEMDSADEVRKAVFGQAKNSPPAEVMTKPFFFGPTDK